MSLWHSIISFFEAFTVIDWISASIALSVVLCVIISLCCYFCKCCPCYKIHRRNRRNNHQPLLFHDHHTNAYHSLSLLSSNSLLKSQSLSFNLNRDPLLPPKKDVTYTSFHDHPLNLPPQRTRPRNSFDFGSEVSLSLSVLEPSLETFTANDYHLNQDNHRTVVPARDILMKMPLYSTPLTMEATSNAYRDFYVRLSEMGWRDKAEAALICTNAESIEAAVEFILNNDENIQYHRFVPLLYDRELCGVCGMLYKQHLIDENAKKINIYTENDDEYLHLMEHLVDMKIDIDQTEMKRNDMFQFKYDELFADKLDKYENVKQCLVCFDLKNESEFNSAECGHNYCFDCLREHYRIKTVDGDVLKLCCIDPNCHRQINEAEILSFLGDSALKDKFLKFKKQRLIMLKENARFCCKPDCDGYMFGSQFRRKLKCPKCTSLICYNCGQPWHGYFVGCNQNIDLGFTKWALNKDVQKCPKCRIRIEKSQGCNHMTCRACRYEFCWICRGEYSSKHYRWYNIFGCPGGQYTARFCRCPSCFPKCLNRILIVAAFVLIGLPIFLIVAIFAALFYCLQKCLQCFCGDCYCDDYYCCDC